MKKDVLENKVNTENLHKFIKDKLFKTNYFYGVSPSNNEYNVWRFPDNYDRAVDTAKFVEFINEHPYGGLLEYYLPFGLEVHIYDSSKVGYMLISLDYIVEHENKDENDMYSDTYMIKETSSVNSKYDFGEELRSEYQVIGYIRDIIDKIVEHGNYGENRNFLAR